MQPKKRGYEIEKFHFHPPGHSYSCQSRKGIHYLVDSVSAILGISIPAYMDERVCLSVLAFATCGAPKQPFFWF